jgi:paraquat-inducible protein B
MTDTPSPAQLDVRMPERGPRRRFSLIWLVPILALIIILSVAYRTYKDRGVLVEISFQNGSGITKETVIKYRDINVGIVEKVNFSDDLEVVVVHARIDQEIAPYLDDDAQFWVVRPDVTLRGVSGLDTVLSGVYIAGKWDRTAEVKQDAFTGLEDAPLLPFNEEGVEILFRAPSGVSLARGAPILHRGLKVGFIDDPVLDPDGVGVTAAAFIEQEFVPYVTTNTRFWDTSGFSISVGATGLALNVDSIASLIEGGIAFDTVVSGGDPIGQNAQPDVFDIFDNETAARESLFESPDTSLLTVGILFDETVNGLTAGAAVKYRGVRVGEVSAINAIVVDEDGTPRVRLRTTLELSPSRIGIAEDTSEQDAMIILAGFVEQGLRARLVTNNILTGALEIELIEVAEAPVEVMDVARDPFPIIPTTESEVADVAATAEGVLKRINDLPIEELMQGAIDLMAGIETFATDGDLRAAPEELLALLGEVRDVIGSDGVQNTPAALQATLTGIEQVVADIAAIVDDAAKADLIGSIKTTLNTTDSFVAGLGETTSALPQVIDEFEALVAKANALEFDALLEQTNATLASIDALVASDDVVALPGSVTQALDEVRTLVTDVRQGGAIDNLNAALAATSNAARSVETSVRDLPDLTERAVNLVTRLEAATENLPQITAEIEALAVKANSVEVEALIDQATATLGGIDAFISAQGTQGLPAAITSSLREVDLLLADIREGGAVQNVNAALASASQAAQAIETAAEGLPALSQQATRLVNTINSVAAVYGDRGRFISDTAATLRDIQEAADAVASLARAIQRNPNSLLTGR